ncbi:Uncharacterised protein [Corynebacterium imitans]|uniref:Uncharacterized protein n=1 Tax=Corynebacterium imitans TaxID=156978 RepID=A0A239YWP9_9CORY|nr:Uncharacterised protein [Corynebacterium imitans]
MFASPVKRTSRFVSQPGTMRAAVNVANPGFLWPALSTQVCVYRMPLHIEVIKSAVHISQGLPFGGPPEQR